MEDFFETLAGLGGELHVIFGADFGGESFALFGADILGGFGVGVLFVLITDIDLAADQNVGCAGEVVDDFGVPLLGDGVEGELAGSGKDQQHHIGTWITERSQTIIVLLTGRIPQVEKDRVPFALLIAPVVLKNGGHVL